MVEEIFDADGKPIEPHDADGNLIEGKLATEEEVKEKEEEAKQGFEDKLEEKLEESQGKHDEAMTKKDEEIEQAKKDLENGKGGDKGKNLSGQRGRIKELEDEKEEAEKKHKGEMEEMGKRVDGVVDKFTEQSINSACLEAAGGDKELADKILGHFNTFEKITEEDKEKRAELFKERIASSKILATGGEAGSAVADVAGTGGGHVPKPPGEVSQEVPSEEMKQMGKDKMGLTEEDFKAHKKAKEEGKI